MNEFRVGEFRLSAPYKDVFRIEFDPKEAFDRRGTLFAPRTGKEEAGDFEVFLEGSLVKAHYGVYEISFDLEKGFENLVVQSDGKDIHLDIPTKNSGELPFPNATPKVFALLDSPKVYVPEAGYFAQKGLKDNGFVFDKEAKDLYLIFCGGDWRLLRKAYIAITGPSELVSFSALGAWDSKYFEYDDASIQEEIDLYKKHGLPLDNFVIDTDWRSPENNGAGYKVNEKDFPDIRKTFENIHSENLTVMFNDHPEPVNGAENAFDPKEVEFRESNLRNLLELGLDYWWYDRNWWTRLKSPIDGLAPESIGLYLYHDVTKRHNQKTKIDDYPKRTLIMGNIDEVTNGVYKGITNSASHRYSIQWTGDTYMSGESLKQEIGDIVRCGNNMIPYANSDLSGHMGDGDDDLYIRWLEYGALSPIMRLHSTKGQKRYRQPWLYGKKALKAARNLYRLRYSLLPLFYSLAHRSYEEGMPIVGTPEFHGDKEYSSDKGMTLMLGDSLVYSIPIPKDQSLLLTKENVPEGFRIRYFKNRKCSGKCVYEEAKDSIDFSTKPGESPLPDILGPEDYSLIAEGTLVGGKEDMRLLAGSDDGVRVYLDGKLVISSWLERAFAYDEGPIIKAHSKHHIVIKYFQGGGGAALSLRLRQLSEREDEAETYLPKGNWINLFDGTLIQSPRAGRTIKGKYGFGVFPLYAKEGTIFVKGKEVERTAYQTWDELYIDLFPSKKGEGSFALYEDDRETDAYKDGHWRKTVFSLKPEGNSVVFAISKPEGIGYRGDDAFLTRKCHIRFHSCTGFKPNKAVIGEEELSLKKISKDKKAFSLPNKGAAPDGIVYECVADISVAVGGIVRFLLD